MVHADETSWWVGGPKWWLWVFTNAHTTVYEVRPTRAGQVVEQMLGSDCLNSYDGLSGLQHKCYAHHHKAIAEAMEQHPRQGAGFLHEVRILLYAAGGLKKAQLPLERFRPMRAALEQAADRLLNHARDDPLEERVRNRLFKQRDHLFTFLDHEAVEATNPDKSGPSANCVRPSSPAKSPVATRLPMALAIGRSLPVWRLLAANEIPPISTLSPQQPFSTLPLNCG